MPPTDQQPQTTRPVYHTDLAQTPLPEIMVTIYRHKAPGTLDCRRGSETKEIYVENGQIIFAGSNQVRDSLGDKLLREGKITQEQYDESVRRLVATGKRQGTILTEMRVIDPEELFTALRQQIQEIVWSVFAWDAGAVTFTPGRPKQTEFVKLDIEIPQAILQGIRRMPDAKGLVPRLGSKTTVLARHNSVEPALVMNAEEKALYNSVDGKRTLYELVNTPPLMPADNARILYALLALQLIVVKPQRQIKVQVRTDGDTYTAE